MTRAARIRREVWATGDAASELRQAEFDLDRIDLEVAGLRTIRVARSRDVLHDLGFDVDDYTPLPLPRPIQQRRRRIPTNSSWRRRSRSDGSLRTTAGLSVGRDGQFGDDDEIEWTLVPGRANKGEPGPPKHVDGKLARRMRREPRRGDPRHRAA